MSDERPTSINEPNLKAEDIRQIVTDRLAGSIAQVLALRLEALLEAAVQARVPMCDTDRLVALASQAPAELVTAENVLNDLAAALGIDDDGFRETVNDRVEEIIRAGVFRMHLPGPPKPRDIAC